MASLKYNSNTDPNPKQGNAGIHAVAVAVAVASVTEQLKYLDVHHARCKAKPRTQLATYNYNVTLLVSLGLDATLLSLSRMFLVN